MFQPCKHDAIAREFNDGVVDGLFLNNYIKAEHTNERRELD